MVELEEREAIEAADAIIEVEKADPDNTYYGQGRGYMLQLVHLFYKYKFVICVKEKEE